MKNIKKFFYFPIIFLLLSISLHAAEIANDQFTSDLDGWSGNGISWTNGSDNAGWMKVDRDRTGSKTYYLTSTNANQTVTISFRAWVPDKWENSGGGKDYLRIFINGVEQETYTSGGGLIEKTFTATADSNGMLTIGVNPDSTVDNEPVYVDWIKIDGNALAQIPPVMGDVPNQTAIINTPFSLDISSYVTLTNGDPVTSYTLTGTLPDGLSFNSSTGMISGTPTTLTSAISLSVTATDNDGESNSDTFTIAVTEFNIESNGGRDFELRQQKNLFGDVTIIGNSVICLLNNNGECINSTSSNGSLNLSKTPESYSTLSLPQGAEVKYARLYWQGRKDPKAGDWDSGSKSSAKQIKIGRDGSTFTTISADILDVNNNSYRTYSASAEITNYIKTNGSGKYYIDPNSFYTITGKPDGLGAYGAWTLVVVYKDPNETKARNISIFDGYKIIDGNNPVEVAVTGFLTPKSGLVDSKVYSFVGEGDKYITGDDLLMKGEFYNTSYTSIAADPDNAFNSTINVPGDRNPDLQNNNGIDIQKYDVGTTSGAFGIITNNEQGASFKFTTDGDVYFPSLLVISTELYLPQMCYDYSIRQDGHFLDIDRYSYPKARLDSFISSSDIEVTVYLRNQESDLVAKGIAIKSDVNDTMFDQKGDIYTSNTNGSTLIDRGSPTYTNPLCDYNANGDNSVSNSGCTNGHDIRKGNGSLDAGDYVYTKYILEPKNINGLADVNQSLGLSVRYYITANGNKVVYPDYELGGVNVPLCTPASAYTPTWGQFNVVQSGQTSPIYNNINTQISRKPFDANVVFDSTPTTGDNAAPTSDIHTTVLVEIIDIDSFGDINASCANPDSNVTAPIFVPINFTPSNYQANITSQNSDYYNIAVKNAAFRIWYFADNNQTLIQNWSATTTNGNKTVTGISGLYNSATHTACASRCTDDTSTDCFECIKENYAQPICSRDNFSIRPESYDLRIYDVNNTLPGYDINTDPTNIKNTTKVDLSSEYHYSPDFSTPSEFINLAAGYNYRFDMSATGNDGLAPVPGYTRRFNNSSDYNATMYWNPPSLTLDCNDDSNVTIPFYIANGLMQNQERKHTNVGKYKLNIIDKTWTAVDWINMNHHSTANNFLSGTDCDINSNSSTLSAAGKYGCTIDTNHGSDGNGHTYKDQDLIFHPYKFDLNGTAVGNPIVPTVGLNFTPVVATDSTTQFVYMSDINNTQDENMSYHLNGSIVALGEDNSTLSNFVDKCYAVPLDINISTSNRDLNDSNGNHVAYQIRFHDINSTGSVINTLDINRTETNSAQQTNDIRIQTVQTPIKGYFQKNQNGRMETRLNLNYDRKKDTTVNPASIKFKKYKVNCTNAANDCTFNADLDNNKTTKASKDLNTTNIIIDIKHYYGRTHAPRTIIQGTDGNVSMYYEVFCNGSDCNKTLLQDGTDSNTTDDPRWFVNTKHTILRDGNISSVTQKNGAGVVSVGALINNTGITLAPLTYDGTKGYPYKTTMENNASGWLIYNKYNPNATKNEFEVEFVKPGGDWAGVHETNATTNRNATDKTNRRLMW